MPAIADHERGNGLNPGETKGEQMVCADATRRRGEPNGRVERRKVVGCAGVLGLRSTARGALGERAQLDAEGYAEPRRAA